MPLIPLAIPKGVYRNGTEYMQQGRWRDANLVRWHEDALRPIGGWRQRSSVDFGGVVRGMLAWSDNSNNRYLAAGLNDSLKVMTAGNAIYDITPTTFTTGRVDADYNNGFGGGAYGRETYGTARSDGGVLQDATTWSLDTFGEYLLACSTDDGKILEWQLGSGSDAAALSNAPTSNTAMMVTEERFVFALGAGGNPRKVQWCDRENNTTWAPAATNEAGDIELQTSGKIMAGLRTRGQALILTDQDAHSATYQGPPFVYGFERVGTSCGLIGPMAAASIDAGVIWMGRRTFFIYSGGTVKEIPCEVGDYIFSDINRDQRSKVAAVINAQWNEIWWFYPSSNSTECDRYVAYDYVENVWSIGSIGRTSGVDRNIFRDPLWASPDGDLYEHEVGFDYSGSTPFAETGPITIGAGDRTMRVTSLIPDEKTQGDVTAKFKTRFYPNASESEFGPFNMSNPTDVRFTGRQVRMRVEGNADSDWRVGVMRIEAKAGSKR